MQESYLFQIIWGKLNENCHYRTDLSFELMNYQGFQNNHKFKKNCGTANVALAFKTRMT
jgi:hypothetical protein